MTKTSIVGTIKKITAVKAIGTGKDYVLTIKEHDNWSLVFDNNYYRRNRSRLKKDRKFLFEGYLVYSKPDLIVHDVLSRSSDLKPEKIVGKGKRDRTMMSLNGKISKIKIIRTMKLKQKMAYVEFEDFPNINIIIFPEEFEQFHKVYKKKKNITVIGKLIADRPKFVIKKATKLL